MHGSCPRAEEAVEHERYSDVNCNQCLWNSPEKDEGCDMEVETIQTTALLKSV